MKDAMRILLVEDNVEFAKAICEFLRAKEFVVEHAWDIKTARSMLPVAGWGAVLLDWNLPDGEGVSLLAYARMHAAQASVIMLTARDQISDRIRGLDEGADDFLVKPFDPDELLARLRAVERRRSGLASACVDLGALQVDLARSTVSVDGIAVELTTKEWALLRVLASRSDRAHSRESLINAVYEYNDEIGSNTLEVFIRRLRVKLGRDSIQTQRGQGYRLTGGASAG
jgi:two-component system, OmpR family, response regulator